MAERPLRDLDVILNFKELVVVLVAEELALVHTLAVVSLIHQQTAAVVQGVIDHLVCANDIHGVIVRASSFLE